MRETVTTPEIEYDRYVTQTLRRGAITMSSDFKVKTTIDKNARQKLR